MKIVILIALLVFCTTVPARAQTEARSPKTNGYGVFDNTDTRSPKINGYGVLHGTQAQTSKINAYVIMTACIAVPKLLGYGVLESAENILRELLPLPKPAHAQWWPLLGSGATSGSPGPCR